MWDFYRGLWPIIRCMEAERAHRLAVRAMATGWIPTSRAGDSPILKQTVWGMEFPNPVGLAAGFDKDAETPGPLLAAGFGFVEVGTVTPLPQPGNPRPRLFRLESDQAVINRMGFNNAGMEAMAARLMRRRPAGIIGVNVGRNKSSTDAIADYVKTIGRLARFADYIVINVSSPNTPGLRALQGRDPLTALMHQARTALAAAPIQADRSTPPLLLKIAPDLTEEDLADIAAVALDQHLDGIICTNTTITRPDSLRSAHAQESGGLSGAPVRDLSTTVVSRMYELVGGRIPLIGVGGIASGADAYAKIRAGATLVQLYTALVYGGPNLVTRIKSELAHYLTRDGFDSIQDAVGADHRSEAPSTSAG